ncbi:uncharacterized protein LOC143039726 [Oratosquilla oratoria]|uniref:uncharacterized protein LOC143039726 n=1 Tax=Oratosquilla oratoria TaxID=337810 RepID=UPI003F75D64F
MAFSIRQTQLHACGSLSDPFEVQVEVKQGCVIAPVLFNIILARTKVSTLQVIERQYADDCAVVIAHDDGSLQNILDTFSFTYSALGLKDNTLKTEVLVQCTEPPEAPFQCHMHGEPIKTAEHVTYLESILTPDCSVYMEIQKRMHLASAVFGQLRDRVFSNNNLRIDTKAAVYRAVMGPFAKDKVIHDELYHRTQITSIETTMAQ